MLRCQECRSVRGTLLLAAALTVSCVEGVPPPDLSEDGPGGAGGADTGFAEGTDSMGGASTGGATGRCRGACSPSSVGAGSPGGASSIDEAPAAAGAASSAGAPSTGVQVAAGGLTPIGVTDPVGAAGASATPSTGGAGNTNSALPECGEVVQWVAATNPPTPLETGALVYYEDTVYEYMGDPQMYHFNVDCPPVDPQSWCAPQGHFYRALTGEDECRAETIVQPG